MIYKLKILAAFLVFVIVLAIITANVMAFQFNGSDQSARDFFQPLNVPFRIEKIQHEGQTIRYVETGLQKPNSPLILFIHGAPGSWGAFKGYLADYELKQVARLISMDRLGYGNSNRGQAVTDIKKHVEAALAIINRYEASEVYIVGHSYGGPIVGNLAANYPNQIKGALMIAPLIDPDNEPVRWYAHLCNLKILRPFLPAYINVATKEKMTHSQALENISNDWSKIEVPVIHLSLIHI